MGKRNKSIVSRIRESRFMRFLSALFCRESGDSGRRDEADMGKRRRSLVSQVRTCAVHSTKFGRKKYLDKRTGNSQKYLYSRNTKRNVTNFWLRMVKDIQQHNPEVRNVKDLKVEHVQGYFDRHASEWTSRTYETYVSYAHHLASSANNVWESCNLDFKGLSSKHPDCRTESNTGQRTFTSEDLSAIKQNMSPHSWAKLVPEIIEILGVRIDEAVHILPEAVRIPDSPGVNGDFGSVALYETKGGRARVVPIPDRESCEKMREMRDRAVRNGWTTLTAGLAASTVSHQILAAKKRAGLQEKYQNVGAHGVRRYYAREHYQNEYARISQSKEFHGKNRAVIERVAWAPTQQNLGHGKHHRAQLWNVYAGGDDPE